jgi:hypothetical protein
MAVRALVVTMRGMSYPSDSAAAARTLGRHHEVELRRVGRDGKQPVFRPIRLAWRVKVAHGRRGRSPVGEVVREHDHVGDRLATGRLHCDHLAPPVPRQGSRRALPVAA